MKRHFRPLPLLDKDIQIAQRQELRPIVDVAAELGLDASVLRLYGPHIAKIEEAAFHAAGRRGQGRLILVTAMTATRAGEGKTVTSIGLGQALRRLGKRAVTCLREPSLGPTFGFKGGATGGGYAQMLPMEEINLHFTGDLHAIATAHNLLAALLDNHIYHGNQLGIDTERVLWRRAMDLCDRQLRHCDTGLGSRFDGMPRRSGFDITAASEVMAILALAEDMKDLERRLRRIHLAYRKDGSPVYAEELGCVPALCVLLKDALQPNLVQNLEGGPVIVHCGPFANIAHGCNSVRATKLGMGLADYVVTEAGFAADLGAEKFLHIKCRQAGLQPELAVLVLSCRALKLHGGVPFEEVNQENRTAIQAGWENARVHIENLARMGLRTLVAINRFPQDTDYELDAVFELCQEADVPCRLSEVAALGGKGGESLAEAVLEMTEQKAPDPSFVYSLDASITQKIEALASTIYRADGVDYTSEAEASIKYLEEIGCGGLPLCTAKTQLSISDKSDRLGAPTNYRLQVRDVSLSHGAGFLVLKTGKILLMPGMGQEPAAQSIGLDSEGHIQGLS